MHPQNTQDQAPPDAVERAARAYTETLAGRAFTDDEWAATRSQAEVEAMRAALAAAMPTATTEWGVRYPASDSGYLAYRSERHARLAADRTDMPLVSREVTEWREVTP